MTYDNKLIWLLLHLISFPSFSQEAHPLKLGIGVVALTNTYDQTKVITIYKDKKHSRELVDFKLYGDLKTVLPFYYKPDYGICYFICLEKQNDFYRILINDSDEGFLPITNDNYFKSWESVLINFSVERLDLKNNPLKENPNSMSKTISPQAVGKVDRLGVMDVIETKNENWIKVSYSKSGQVPCVRDAADCGEAWIRWRDGDRLLVNILLLD